MNADCRRELAKTSNLSVNRRIASGSEEGRDNSNAKFVEGAQTAVNTHRTMHNKLVMIPGHFKEERAWSLDRCALSEPSVFRKLPRRMRRRESG